MRTTNTFKILVLPLVAAMALSLAGCHKGAIVEEGAAPDDLQAETGEIDMDIADPEAEGGGSEEDGDGDGTADTALSISTTAVAPGTFGVDYEASIDAAGGSGSSTIEVTGLPDGLAISDGAISGKPMAAGTFPLTVKATDSETAESVETTLDLVINKEVPEFVIAKQKGDGTWEAVTGDVSVPGNVPVAIGVKGEAAGYKWQVTPNLGVCITKTSSDVDSDSCDHPLGDTQSKLVAVFKPTPSTVMDFTYQVKTEATANSEEQSKGVKFTKMPLTPLEPSTPLEPLKPPMVELTPVEGEGEEPEPDLPVFDLLPQPKIKKVQISLWTGHRNHAQLDDGYPVMGFYNGASYTDCKPKLCNVRLTFDTDHSNIDDLTETGNKTEKNLFSKNEMDEFEFAVDEVPIEYFKYFRLKVKDKGSKNSHWFLQKMKVRVQDTDDKWHTTYYNPCVDRWVWGDQDKWINYGQDDWAFCARIGTRDAKKAGTDTAVWLVLDTAPLGDSGVSYDARSNRDRCSNPQTSPWFYYENVDYGRWDDVKNLPSPEVDGKYYMLRLDYRSAKKDGGTCKSSDDFEKGDDDSYGGVLRAPWAKPPEVRICMYPPQGAKWGSGHGWKPEFFKILAFRPALYFRNKEGKKVYYETTTDLENFIGKILGRDNADWDGPCFPKNHWWKLKLMDGKDIFDYKDIGKY